MNITVMGTGLMGRPMAERLKTTGRTVTVYNRTADKVADLPKAGIAVAASPADALRAGDCVVVMLSDAQAIREVLLAPAARQELRGRTVIQMGTIGPRESQEFQRAVQAAGGDYLEAPVMGSITEVKEQRLLVMVGGTEAQFEQWAGLLKAFGPEPRLVGPVGSAAALKLALNQLIAAEIAAFSLSLGLVQREGIAVETFMEILRQSALFAPAFEKKLPRLLRRDYTDPNFSTRHLLKDVDLFLKEAAAVGLNVSSLEGVRPLLGKAVEQGLADVDYSALFESVNPATQAT